MGGAPAHAPGATRAHRADVHDQLAPGGDGGPHQRETNLASTGLLVEEVLAERDVVDAIDLPGALRAWRIGKDATVSLINRSEFTHVRVQAAVMTIDATADRAVKQAGYQK